MLKLNFEWWINVMKTYSFSFVEVIPGTPEYATYLRLRYDVFCEELNRVEVPDPTLGMETDIYDQYSRHFLGTHIETGAVAACVRLIFPNPVGLNIHARYEINKELVHPDALPHNTAEISRMAISSTFRKRRDDSNKPISGDPQDELPNAAREPFGNRKHQPEIVLGMYREIYRLSKETGIEHCMAAMDPVFSRLLTTIGLPFIAIGPVNMTVRPARRPFIISDRSLEQQLRYRNPSLLEFLSEKAA